MTVSGPAFCFKCNRVIITQLSESKSSNPDLESLGAEIRDRLSPGTPILLGHCPNCNDTVGRIGYHDCHPDFESTENQFKDDFVKEADFLSRKIRKSLEELEGNLKTRDNELEKRIKGSKSQNWDNKEKERNNFFNKISDIDIFKYRKPDGGIDWDKYHEERRRRKNSAKSTEFSDEDKEELR
tara:strand:+ start:5619 stop:6167 length:549 start_codon:yes stop_codon:yes gene_type:complete